LRGGKARTTGQVLFGREHASRLADFPSGLARLVQATGGALGSAEQILRQRTVLAAYWPFATAGTRKMVLAAATEGRQMPISMALGLPGSRMRGDHPLRYCEQCHQEALASDGYSTWLLEHQLPGVWWCVRHRRPLAQAPKRQAIWRKPGCDGVLLGHPIDAQEGQALHTMARLAAAIASLERVETAALSAAVVHRLRQLGIASSAARLNSLKVGAWLQRAPLIRWMQRQGGLVAVPGGNWAVELIRGRTRSHPLKWQILWTCVWQESGPVDSAVQAFVDAAGSRRPLTPADQRTLWAADEMRPQRLPLPECVAQAFARHATLRDVARALGATVGAARKWLADYPDLTVAWPNRLREERLHRAVTGIELQMREQPDLGRTQLLDVCNTEFNWLSRHAPATARALLDRVPTDRGPQRELF
jgi:hypothetical protein